MLGVGACDLPLCRWDEFFWVDRLGCEGERSDGDGGEAGQRDRGKANR